MINNKNIKPVKLYDSYLKKLVEIKSENTTKENVLKMYSCGPTVYNYQHIGNMRASWLPQTVKNLAILSGWDVEWVLNITDVGHLVGDVDDGEDKLEKGAKREGKSVPEIVKFYTQDFINQCNLLNITLPKDKMLPKATEYIPEQMILALRLLSQNKAYLLEDGIYFDSHANKDLQVPFSVEVGDNSFTDREIKNTTKNPADFALWKFVNENSLQKWRFADFKEASDLAKNIYHQSIVLDNSNPHIKDLENEKQQVYSQKLVEMIDKWGCPGWHSECVAMICKILNGHFPPEVEGDKSIIDLHFGGEDHIDIHHKNEILQSKSLGFDLSKNWVHNKFVTVDNKKMAKSEGNVFLVDGEKNQTGFYSISKPPFETFDDELKDLIIKKYQELKIYNQKEINQDTQEWFNKNFAFDPLAYRLLLFEHHYRETLNFTWHKLWQSQVRLWNLRKLAAKILAKSSQIEDPQIAENIELHIENEKVSSDLEAEFLDILSNDLSTPLFLEKFAQKLDELAKMVDKNEFDWELFSTLLDFEHNFLKLDIFYSEKIEPELNEAHKLGQTRWGFKLSKDYQKTDEIRNQISQLGFQTDDYSWGFGIWKR